MRNEKKYAFAVAVPVALFSAIAFSYLSLPKIFSFGQNDSLLSEAKMFVAFPANERAQTLPDPTVSPALISKDDKPAETKIETAAFSPLTLRAAEENARLQTNLSWAFGGKAQRGWSLFIPLIQQTLAVKQYANTPEFANAVGDFQQESAMTPNGILDDKTLYKIIEFWQARRLKNSDYPSPENLLTAPVADFYDPSRAPELMKVERETYAAYKRMVAAAAKDKSLNLRLTQAGELAPDEKFLKIVSAFRSREYQEKLRRESPNSGRAGLATNSPHFTGRAIDIYVGGEPVTTKDFNRAVQVQTPVYKWLVKNAERFGFRPYFYEPWHWEFIPENLRKTTAR